MMTPATWKKMLEEWSEQLRNTDLVERLDAADRELTFLGYGPATEKTIAELEGRLGVALPPSYRAFLKASDGFRLVSRFIKRLRPASEVSWFREENLGWIEAYNEPTPYDDPDFVEPKDEIYFDYSTPTGHFRNTHLMAMLQVSDVDDGVMLLNPLAVTPDGEWEAWFFANWVPGAERYASFAHMMVKTLQWTKERKHVRDAPKLPRVNVPGPRVKRHSIIEAPELPAPRRKVPRRKKGQSQLEYIARYFMEPPEEEVAPAPSELVKLVEGLNTTDGKARRKTIRALIGRQKVRAKSARHPDLVPRVAEMARALSDAEARAACVMLLAHITPDGPAPSWLKAALQDPDLNVKYHGLSALYYFKGPELVDPIIKILSESRDMGLSQQAASALSQIPDVRAIPVLVKELERSFEPPKGAPPAMLGRIFEQHYTSIAINLAKYGQRVVPALVKLLQHEDRNRRIAAIVGLRAIGEVSSRQAVAALKGDVDAEVRKQVEICDAIWGDSAGFEMHDL